LPFNLGNNNCHNQTITTYLQAVDRPSCGQEVTAMVADINVGFKQFLIAVLLWSVMQQLILHDHE